jgi:hypothetical protein
MSIILHASCCTRNCKTNVNFCVTKFIVQESLFKTGRVTEMAGIVSQRFTFFLGYFIMSAHVSFLPLPVLIIVQINLRLPLWQETLMARLVISACFVWASSPLDRIPHGEDIIFPPARGRYGNGNRIDWFPISETLKSDRSGWG